MNVSLFKPQKLKQAAHLLLISALASFLFLQALERLSFIRNHSWLSENTLDFTCGFLTGYAITALIGFLVFRGVLACPRFKQGGMQ